MLQIENIKKIYNNGGSQVTALKGISVTFPSKGMVFILGKSGAGKSTLLNILGGLDKANDGEIIINGNKTSDFKAGDFDAYRNYHVGFIFQEFNLIDDLSVKDNIAIALKIQSKGHDNTTIDEALKLVNLEGLGYRTPKELSGGQKQRISVARALVKNPSVILADEPTGALDSKTGYELMSSLKTLSKDKLVIVATHDEEMPYVFGDEIIIINDGELVKHLVVSDKYKKAENETISDKIIKINSGNEIVDSSIINEKLKKGCNNYICLTDNPELLTIAHPESYEQVFKKDDFSDKFVELDKEKDNTDIKEKKNKKKAGIGLKECFMMALHQFSSCKGKIVFLLVFITLAISVLGFSYLVSKVDNSRIISNTLINNQMELGIMEKDSNGSKMILKNSDITNLKNKFEKTNFAIAKEIEINYTSGIRKVSSSFEMSSFKGIVESDDVSSLNLKPVAGVLEFNENSLTNHEIIISDYAAYELRRTGYLGSDNKGNYGLNNPSTVEEQINSTILINNYEYKIIGVFDTNFEDYLSLLVSETYVDDEQSQASSLDALKSYYFARIFGPVGFYSTFIDENEIFTTSNLFRIDVSDIPVYAYNSESEELISDYSLASLTYANFSKFVPFSEVNNENFTVTTIWGEIPEKLNENEIIVTNDWISNIGLIKESQYESAFSKIENSMSVRKLKSDGSTDTYLYNGDFKIVAVVDVSVNNTTSITKSYSSTFIYFSDEYAKEFTSSIYGYDQVLFTLSGNRRSYNRKILKIEETGYSVINIDGSTFETSDIEALKSTALLISIIMILFAFLIMMNYVSSNVKNREKEIGILRATGAQGKDIVRIFAVEEGMLAIITSIISLLIISYASNLLNGILGNIELSIEIIHFDILEAIFIILATILFFLLTTLIPVLRIASKKPIDAIRNA